MEESVGQQKFIEYLNEYKSFSIPRNTESLKPILINWGRIVDPAGYNPINFSFKTVNPARNFDEKGCYNEVTIYTSNDIFRENIEVLKGLLNDHFGSERRFKIVIVHTDYLVI